MPGVGGGGGAQSVKLTSSHPSEPNLLRCSRILPFSLSTLSLKVKQRIARLYFHLVARCADASVALSCCQRMQVKMKITTPISLSTFVDFMLPPIVRSRRPTVLALSARPMQDTAAARSLILHRLLPLQNDSAVRLRAWVGRSCLFGTRPSRQLTLPTKKLLNL